MIIRVYVNVNNVEIKYKENVFPADAKLGLVSLFSQS